MPHNDCFPPLSGLLAVWQELSYGAHSYSRVLVCFLSLTATFCMHRLGAAEELVSVRCLGYSGALFVFVSVYSNEVADPNDTNNGSALDAAHKQSLIPRLKVEP